MAKCVCQRFRPRATRDLSTKGSWNVWNCTGGTTGAPIETICFLLIRQENKDTRVVVKSALPTLHNPTKQRGGANGTLKLIIIKWQSDVRKYSKHRRLDERRFFVSRLGKPLEILPPEVSVTAVTMSQRSSPGSNQLYIKFLSLHWTNKQGLERRARRGQAIGHFTINRGRPSPSADKSDRQRNLFVAAAVLAANSGYYTLTIVILTARPSRPTQTLLQE